MREDRHPNPTYAIIDCSLQTLPMQVNKSALTEEKNKGHKRQIIIDSLGCLLAVKVHRANLHDTKASIFPAVKAFRLYPTIRAFCADADYRKTFVANIESVLGLKVDISPKIKAVGFQVIKKRWVVERTFAWLNNSRRLAKDFEKTVVSQEVVIVISHIHTLLKRL